jgi:hypothetical protein
VEGLMKRIFNKLRRGEKGQALIIVLILMLLGGLIIAPVLSYVGSGLIIGKDVHEKRMAELYAADAGVEDGLWYLQDIERLKDLIQDVDPDYVPPAGWDEWTLADSDDVWPLPPYNLGDDINGKNVAVTIDYLAADKTFKITSVATSDDSSTTIDAYLSPLDFSDLLNNAITSTTEVDNKGDVEGTIVDDYPEEDWPLAEELAAWYWDDVKNETPYASGIIDVKDTPVIGPTYTNGDLNIKKTGGSGNTLLTLQGTLYVKGNLETDQTKEFTIDLNKQTIFVENDINIGGFKTSIIGSGCLIAVGNIKFLPTVSSDPDDFIFVMSITGTTTAQPSGDFYGSFAGDVLVKLQPGGKIIWCQWPSDLNFPVGGYMGGELIAEIAAWEISLQ